MNGQMICYAVMNEEAAGDCFRVRFTFNSKQLLNCETGYNRLNKDVLEFVVSKKQRSNFGAIRKKLMQGCSCGSYSTDF